MGVIGTDTSPSKATKTTAAAATTTRLEECEKEAEATEARSRPDRPEIDAACNGRKQGRMRERSTT